MLGKYGLSNQCGHTATRIGFVSLAAGASRVGCAGRVSERAMQRTLQFPAANLPYICQFSGAREFPLFTKANGRPNLDSGPAGDFQRPALLIGIRRGREGFLERNSDVGNNCVASHISGK
jgi:hypothetical protein